MPRTASSSLAPNWVAPGQSTRIRDAAVTWPRIFTLIRLRSSRTGRRSLPCSERFCSISGTWPSNMILSDISSTGPTSSVLPGTNNTVSGWLKCWIKRLVIRVSLKVELLFQPWVPCRFRGPARFRGQRNSQGSFSILPGGTTSLTGAERM